MGAVKSRALCQPRRRRQTRGETSGTKALSLATTPGGRVRIVISPGRALTTSVLSFRIRPQWRTSSYDPGQFVTLVGYENSFRFPSGHHNVFYRGPRGALLHSRDAALPAFWAQATPGEVVTIPHHTAALARPSRLGIDWPIRDDRFRRAVEAYSSHGQRMGLLCSSDTHASQPGVDGFGLTAMLAPVLTRESVFDATWHRRTFGTTGARILARAGGQWHSDGG